jgi:hypothetical protein
VKVKNQGKIEYGRSGWPPSISFLDHPKLGGKI